MRTIMKFDLKLVVGGKPLSVARDLLRRDETFTTVRAAHLLGLNKLESARYLLALVQAGYMEREAESGHLDRPTFFAPTRLGISLRTSRKTARFSRPAGDHAVAALLDVIGRANSNPDLISSVEDADLFGSYAEGADDLGDVDVAVLLKRRLPLGKEWAAASLERAEKTGGRMNHVDQITWGEEEVRRALRAASPRLDIQDKSDIVTLGTPLTPLFRASTV
jgi:hypothetical protein